MKAFSCKRCGACCKGESTVSLSLEEMDRIAKYLSLDREVFIEKFTVIYGKNRIEMKTKEGYCIFYDKDNNHCLIHPVKPVKCKEWPFPLIIFSDRENFEIIKASCPGLEFFSFEDIKQSKNLTK
ncbi:MAG: YkgJ family cysteine cluster protein [Caldimicrobium sp.]|nr:YkgJ family cysteine cluster protein [Caldimicrobium sp.]MCX7614036.1 YkgJ family cysteine cluster protein [Caldimicrobium sp.]MDW8182348.1 YkgJ family cysteine cluster protein [Caldimicrobium sp.]